MKILAIDTSCDDTSVAVTDGVKVLSNVISSQVRYHKKYGGVVPMLAARLHGERIDAIIAEALQRAGLGMADIEALAVTYGPGLAPALQVGIAKAQELAKVHSLPLYAVNHMAGHIAGSYAQVGSQKRPTPLYPALALLVSGGHSELVLMRSFGDFQIIGQTLDDALGEAYDKVARMLGLGYPGGKVLAQLAEKGQAVYELPVPMLRSGDLNLSYSGLKNAVRLLVKEIKEQNGQEYLDQVQIADIAASFEKVAQESVLRKVERALEMNPEVRQLVLGGGVAANKALRARLRQLAKTYGVALLLPANQRLCMDNAAMIGAAAYLGMGAGQKPIEPEKVDRVPYLSLEDAWVE